ncbi:TIR domain-containing protein [Dyella sp. KULCS107]|uniref:TIR domain-containing protein n=1 Tax=Dyella sp. KULCS107 TaxID=3422216 RepID=UPI003D6FEE4D
MTEPTGEVEDSGSASRLVTTDPVPAVEPDVDSQQTCEPVATSPDSLLNGRGLIVRFQGAGGRRHLRRQVLDNSLVRGSDQIADALIDHLSLQELQPGQKIIEQGASDNDLFLVLSGAFSVKVNGREVASRTRGSHFGEMALVDSTARRAATIVANEYSIIARIPEEPFERIADQYPELWRRLAIEISRRLDERSRSLRPPREKPAIFIGCSTESRPIAEAIQLGMQYDPFVSEVWTDGVFRPSNTPIEDLNRKIGEIDFGVMIVTPDDQSEVRGTRAFTPRDNVIFELGLLIGALGRERVMLVQPRGTDIKIPSDLSGVNPITYSSDNSTELRVRVAPVCTELRSAFSRIGPL